MLRPFLPFLILIASHGSALLSLLFLMKWLSPDDAGRLNTGLAIQGYVILIGTCGLRTLLVREVARDPRKLPYLLTNHYAITSIAGLLVSFLALIMSTLFLGGTREELWMRLWLACGAWIATTTPFPFLDALGRQTRGLAIVAVTEVGFLACLAGGMIPLELPVIGAAFAIKWSITSVLHGVDLAQHGNHFSRKLSLSASLDLMIRAFPLMLTSLISTLPITGTVVMVRLLCGIESSAVMGLASQLAGGYLLIAGVAYRYVQPQFRNIGDLKDLTRRRSLRRVAGLLLAAWMCLLAFSWGLTHWGLPPIYGEGFPTIAALLVASLFGAASLVGWTTLLALENERAIFWSYFFGALLFLISGWGLTRPWGSVGAAIAGCLGTGLTVVLMSIFHNRTLARLLRKPGLSRAVR